MLISGAFVPAARLLVNAKVIGTLGIEANGLLAVPFQLTGYYTPFLTSALWGRMHPTVARVGSSPEGRHELTVALRMTVGLATAAIVTILFLKELLVRIAYSPAFAFSAHLVPAQLLGDYFYFVALPFTVYALGLSRLRVYVAANLAYSVIAAAISFKLLRSIGLVGVPIGYGVSAGLGATVAVGWFIRHRDAETPVTLAFMAGGLVIVMTQCFLAWRDISPILQGMICVVTDLVALTWLWKARST